jgi:hypothetical protein
MEAQLTEASTFPAQLYAKSFFANYPSDLRFLQCSYQKFVSASTKEADLIEFNLDKYDAANVYLIQDTHLEVTIKVTKANGSLPDQTAEIALVNNILHSLWESVRLTINDVPVSLSPGLYPYKAYITNCLTYGSEAKGSHLQTQGWYVDTIETDCEPGDNNLGWESRRDILHENYDKTKPFRKDGVTFFGRLMHDLMSCETGLPPLTKVKIELEKAKDSFCIKVGNKADTEKYKILIEKIALYVPVAQLSQTVFNELSTIRTSKPVAIHFRRLEVRPVTIHKDKSELYTESLFPDSDLPCRIILAFVDSKSKNGDYFKNPFNFQRKWETEDECTF